MLRSLSYILKSSLNASCKTGFKVVFPKLWSISEALCCSFRSQRYNLARRRILGGDVHAFEFFLPKSIRSLPSPKFSFHSSAIDSLCFCLVFVCLGVTPAALGTLHSEISPGWPGASCRMLRFEPGSAVCKANMLCPHFSYAFLSSCFQYSLWLWIFVFLTLLLCLGVFLIGSVFTVTF